MKKLLFAICVLAIGGQAVRAQQAKYVVLISVDGFRPDFYMEPSWPAPYMQQIKEQGVYAQGVQGIFPTVTYPSHTTLITGVTPSKHGICYNTPFEPQGASGRWYTEAKDIKAETLWEALRKAGLRTASVSWPVSVGAPVDYNIPETFSLSNPGDRRAATSEQATPRGLFEEVQQQATGQLSATDLNLHYFGMNETLSRMAAYLIGRYKPNLLTIHLPCTDEAQHDEGRRGDRVTLSVAAADHGIGTILEAIAKAGIKDSTAVIITGDHGFVDIHTGLAPNVWLAANGLIGKDGWKAMFHSGGGSTFLQLKQEKDEQTLRQVRKILSELPEAQRKLFRVVERAELDKSGADPHAALALTAVPGISFTTSKEGPAMRAARGGAHGYYPDFREIQTGFVAYGAGLAKGQVIPVMHLEDVAPLVAQLLGVSLKEASGTVYPGMLRK
ncbi:ectonucleotide pyrophosphatase/phosphodiesterase [Chitinophaga pendula]|uniref:alkaline phosphatase family protein n=1 Tax=Chitinophaga TaxID=79328 RepID=UPI000BAEA3BB|nr:MULTISPECIES: ectonucleotide pyrophosphatase/phosphodiesterase [Chitinophaga]ASZ11844.1 AP endonuclease [Chitinophaga sp. MD30]UCJ05129.1 ectonucleotide pyrophosphatase/phosphodiesterase [Chitinophaga pendula]